MVLSDDSYVRDLFYRGSTRDFAQARRLRNGEWTIEAPSTGVARPVFHAAGMPHAEPMRSEQPRMDDRLGDKQALRLHLGPRHKYLLGTIAKEVVAALTLSKCRLVKEPASPPHSTFGAPSDKKQTELRCPEAPQWIRHFWI
jgi:hypothetical protein